MRFSSSRKSRASLLVWRACYCTLAALGLFGFYLTVDGICNGEVALFSKRYSGTVAWAQSPVFFVFTVLAWLVVAFFLLRLAVTGWRED